MDMWHCLPRVDSFFFLHHYLISDSLFLIALFLLPSHLVRALSSSNLSTTSHPRPTRDTNATIIASPHRKAHIINTMAPTQSPPKRKPGRPRKNPLPTATTNGAITKAAPKPRGRPARNLGATKPALSTKVRHSPRKAAMAEATAKIEASSSPSKRRGRGRPAAATNAKVTKTANAAPKPRGRPPKSAQPAVSAKPTKPAIAKSATTSFTATDNNKIQGLENRVKALETRLARLEKSSVKSSKGNYADLEARLTRLEEDAEYLTDVEADAVPSNEEEEEQDEEDEDGDEIMGEGEGTDSNVVVPATQNGDTADGSSALKKSNDIPYTSPNPDNRREMIIAEEVIVQIIDGNVVAEGLEVREQSDGPLGRPENPHAVGIFADIISRFGSPSRGSPARTLA